MTWSGKRESTPGLPDSVMERTEGGPRAGELSGSHLNDRKASRELA